jgi:5-formaminoimidazole-4-carboxamide-1-(beta)-D-ribofuranosyl 5'-monophosphate synthetase
MNVADYTIATLGSHSSLQILHGAKTEGFETLIITTPDRESFYKRFWFIDEVLTVPTFSAFPEIEETLIKRNVILIPHGSFVAHLGIEQNKKMRVPYFGNKKILDWESDRNLQREWLHAANITMPKQVDVLTDDVKFPIIVKTFGAAGGRGYFYAKNKADFDEKVKSLNGQKYVIQEYIIGVTLYVHYFYSPLTNEVEVMSMDRRYETNVDSLGRIPLHGQEGLDIEQSYVVVGNSPLVVRESMLRALLLLTAHQ